MYFVESETVYLYQLMLLTVLELPKSVPPEPVSSSCRLQGGEAVVDPNLELPVFKLDNNKLKVFRHSHHGIMAWQLAWNVYIEKV